MNAKRYLVLKTAMIVCALLLTSSASATTLRSGSGAVGVGTEFIATLKGGSSLLNKETAGLALDTCTSSEIKGKLASVTPSSNPKGSVATLTYGGCTHATTVLAAGELEFINIAGTTNGTVTSRNTRVTVKSTVFGLSCVAATGAGVALGTITGITSGNAVFDVNALITLEASCGGDTTVTGTYLFTAPSGLNTEAI